MTKSILCKKNNETVTLKTNVNLFSRWLSVRRERDGDVQNVLSCELCAVLLYLFYSNGAMICTAKSNLLNEIEIKWYSLPSLVRDLDLGATVMDFMAILESIDYSKFERFSNAADEISPNFLSYKLTWIEVLVVVPDQYDFKIFNKTCWKKTLCRSLNSYAGNWKYC